MLTLYYKPNCPFCNRVLATLDQLGLEAELKDVTSDQAIADELVAHGGKKQEPYLIDSEQGVSMYDSEAIVAHLRSNYGGDTGATSAPRVHQSDSVCTACEG